MTVAELRKALAHVPGHWEVRRMEDGQRRPKPVEQAWAAEHSFRADGSSYDVIQGEPPTPMFVIY